MTELKCGKTHIQFFIEGICIATVRTEYAQAFREAISSYANRRANEISQESK